MSNRIQFRRDTKARWTEVNPVLMEGEIGLETDTHNIKMGDGTHAWNNLEYIVGYDNLTNEVGSSENLAISQKGFTEIIKGIKDGINAYDFPMMRIADFSNYNWDGFNKFLDNLDFSNKKYIGHCKLSVSGRNFDLYNYIFSFDEKIGVQVLKGGMTIKSDGTLTNFDGYKILYRNVNNGKYGEWIDYNTEIVLQTLDGVKTSIQPTYYSQEKNGKIYYLFGDSITYWDDRTSWYDENVKMVAYPSYIRSVLKCTAINKGVAGNTASQITKRLLSTNLSDAYAVTYMAGANDLQSSIRIGEVGTLDDTTYIGNLSKAVEYVLKSYPYVKFYFLAPLWTNKGNIKPYAEAMESVAKYYNVPILRWDLTSCLNSMTADTYYVNEGTTRLHPNNIGHARLADSLIPFLQNC